MSQDLSSFASLKKEKESFEKPKYVKSNNGRSSQPSSIIIIIRIFLKKNANYIRIIIYEFYPVYKEILHTDQVPSVTKETLTTTSNKFFNIIIIINNNKYKLY